MTVSLPEPLPCRETVERIAIRMKSYRRTSILTIVVLVTILAFCGAGCSPTGESSSGSTEGSSQDPVSVEWSMDADCSLCHDSEQESLQDPQCLVSKHEQLACTDCHNDEQALTETHEGTTKPTKKVQLKNTSVPSATCLNCHDTSQLITATASVTVCTDSQGKTVNPHDLPVNDDHAKITCVNCHEMHGTDTADTLAPDECLSCHHKDVYECHTCHE